MGVFEETANLNAEQIIEKVTALNLREQGVYREKVAEKWRTVLAEREEDSLPLKVVAALNNNDTRHAYLQLVKDAPELLVGGLAAAGKAIGTKELDVYLPESEDPLKEQLEHTALEAGVEVNVSLGLVNVRAYEGSPIHHIATLIDLAKALEGTYTPGTYVAAGKYGKYSAMKKAADGTKVQELVADALEIIGIKDPQTEIKALEIGTKVFGPEGLEQQITEDTALSGGTITVITDKECIIAEGEKRLLDLRKTSCGKCTFCREGLIQLHTMAKEITEGKGKAEFLPVMEEISDAMVFSTPCSVGQTGGEYVQGTLAAFKEEYEAHIKKKKCPADVCKSFMSIYIDPNACEGCEECADVCPADCIEGKSGYIHMIDEFDCTKCGKCIEVCEYDAVIQTTGRLPKLPNRLIKCGKFKKR